MVSTAMKLALTMPIAQLVRGIHDASSPLSAFSDNEIRQSHDGGAIEQYECTSHIRDASHSPSPG